MPANVTCACGTPLVRDGVTVAEHWIGDRCDKCAADAPPPRAAGRLAAEREAEIRGKLAAATPGPWVVSTDAAPERFGSMHDVCSSHGPHGPMYVVAPTYCYRNDVADARFIADAPAAITDLLGELEVTRAERDAAVKALDEAAHGLREPMTLADARGVRLQLAAFLNAHHKAQVLARRATPTASAPRGGGGDV